MKILLVSPTPPPIGGMSMWTLNYLDYFKNKHDIKLVDTSMMSENVKKFSIISEIKREATFFYNCLKIKDKDFDLVHFNSPLDNVGIFKDYLGIKLLKKKELKIVLQIHSDVTAQLKWRLSKRIFKKMMKICDEVIALNDNTYNEVIKKRESCQMISNFINSKSMNPYVKNVQNKEIKNICYVGRFNEEKGSKEFLQVAQNFPEISFSVFGPCEQDKAIKLKNVKYYGNLNQRELFKNMGNCDLFLFLSHHEGSPLSIIEASFLNLPIISSNVGNVSKMISSRCIVSGKDLNEIISKIEEFNNVAVRNEIASYNKNIANESTIENVSQKLIEIYKSI